MFHSGKSYLVEESLGTQWHFTLTGQQTIEYSRRTEKVWSKPRQLEGQPIKHYCVTIDKNDNLYLFAYNTSKQLISYRWVEGQWNQQILYSVTSRFETICTLEALTSPTQIHLFYYIENSLKKAQEYLIHSRYDNGEWNRQVLMSFLTGQEGAPHLVRCDEDGNLFCIYTRRIQNQTRCYYVYYNNHEESWSKPSILFQKPGKCSEFSGQTDAGCLHMVWKEAEGPLFRINYRIIDPEKKNSASETICIQEDGAEIQSPCLHVGNEYHCFWLQEEKGMVSHRDPLSKQWDEPFMATEESVTLYGRVSTTLDGRGQPLPQIGDGYPHFHWTLETLYPGNKPEPKSKKTNHRENLSGSFRQDMDILQPQITEIQNRLDDFYTALYQLQEYIRQKDKSSFHTETRIRKLTFELDQLRSIKGITPHKGISPQKSLSAEADHIELESPKMENPDMYAGQASGSLTKDEMLEEKRTPMKNIDRGSGELQLGNVNILINPEDDSGDI